MHQPAPADPQQVLHSSSAPITCRAPTRTVMQLCFGGRLWVGCNICAYSAWRCWFTWGWPSSTSKVPHGMTSPHCAAHLLLSVLTARQAHWKLRGTYKTQSPCRRLDSWFSSTTLCYMNFLKAPRALSAFKARSADRFLRVLWLKAISTPNQAVFAFILQEKPAGCTQP